MVVKRGGYEGILGIEEVLCAGFSRDVSKKEKVCTTGYGTSDMAGIEMVVSGLVEVWQC